MTETTVSYFSDGYYGSSANRLANRGWDTRADAEAARQVQPTPGNWYVWQMNDGRWHVSLMTNRKP